jgi:hypothetical protein
VTVTVDTVVVTVDMGTSSVKADRFCESHILHLGYPGDDAVKCQDKADNDNDIGHDQGEEVTRCLHQT